MSDTACATCMQPYWDCRCAPAAKEPGVRPHGWTQQRYDVSGFNEPMMRASTYDGALAEIAALAAQVEGVTATLIREREFRQQEWLSLHAIINQTKMERDKLTAENAALRELLEQIHKCRPACLKCQDDIDALLASKAGERP